MDVRYLLSHLHYFWAVARSKSFSMAAQQLHISQSAVSYQIKSLEEKLGISLFARSIGQSVRLTREGEDLANECQSIFKHLEASLNRLAEQEISGRLHVTAPVYFGSLVLMPALRHIRDLYPKLIINANLTDQMLDYFDEGIDVGFRTLAPQKSMVGSEFIRINTAIVASTEYLKSAPPINSIANLKEHQFVIYNEANLNWNQVMRLVPGIELPKAEKIIYSSSSFGMREAINVGMGIGILPAYSVEKDINEGRLQKILPSIFENIQNDIIEPLYVCYPRLTYEDKKVTVFIDTFKQYLDNWFRENMR